MRQELYQRVKDIVEIALDRDRDTWPSFLPEACAGDPELLREVRSLLAADGPALADFIERPAWEVLAALDPGDGEDR